MTTFFGLDGEMSTADLEHGGRLIQIGVTAHTNPDGTETAGSEAFSMLLNPGEHAWDLVAEGVHGHNQSDVSNAAPAAEVDQLLKDWLIANGAHPRRRENTIAIGFNVGGFDMPHVAAVLPLSYALFCRRTVDLNAICFTLDGANYFNDGTPRSWKGWKKLAKTYAERTIATLEADSPSAAAQAHDAGYDALLHLHVWRFLRAATHGAPFALPENEVPPVDSETHARALIKALGLDEATKTTGIPHEFLAQWSSGGRATNANHLAALDRAYRAL